MAPGEMAGGGAGKPVGGGAESGGAVCEDWNALTLKVTLTLTLALTLPDPSPNPDPNPGPNPGP